MRAFRAAAMVALCALAVPASVTAAETPKPPVYEKVLVVPFTVEPRALKGVEPRKDQERIVRRLAETAARQAEKTLVRQRIAAAPEKTATQPAVPAGLPEGVRLVGVVEMPVSVPWRTQRSSARFSNDRFAKATVTWLAPDGATVASESGEIRWKDVRWTWGSNHARAVDDVLEEFAAKAVERAVQRLAIHDALKNLAGGRGHASP